MWSTISIACKVDRFSVTYASVKATGSYPLYKNLLLASCALVALSVSATAADLPARANAKAPSTATASNWTGWYGGINGGWAHIANNWVHGTSGADEGTARSNIGTIGAQVGYNFALANRWLLGAELQANWFSSDSTKRVAQNTAWEMSTKTNYLATASARLGYDYGASMSFAKLGLAVSHHKYYNDETTGNSDEQGKATRLGVVTGIGYDYALNKDWRVGVEYDHIFMPRQSIHQYVAATGAYALDKKIKQDVDTVMLRLNYRFTTK
jgi:outer membrane immunogenic protein